MFHFNLEFFTLPNIWTIISRRWKINYSHYFITKVLWKRLENYPFDARVLFLFVIPILFSHLNKVKSFLIAFNEKKLQKCSELLHFSQITSFFQLYYFPFFFISLHQNSSNKNVSHTFHPTRASTFTFFSHEVLKGRAMRETIRWMSRKSV